MENSEAWQFYSSAIKSSIDKKDKNERISRKIFLCYPTFAFQNNNELEFDILDSISLNFNIPFANVQIVGSSKTGYSYIHKREFVKGTSDLDIAIIDTNLFLKYCEIVLSATNGFENLSSFSHNGNSNYGQYARYISKGIFRPDLMPSCHQRSQWFNFFNKLSDNYRDYFSNINAGIYFSQAFFEAKQSSFVGHFNAIKI